MSQYHANGSEASPAAAKVPRSRQLTPAMNSSPAPATAMMTAVPRSGWYPMRTTGSAMNAPAGRTTESRNAPPRFARNAATISGVAIFATSAG